MNEEQFIYVLLEGWDYEGADAVCVSQSIEALKDRARAEVGKSVSGHLTDWHLADWHGDRCYVWEHWSSEIGRYKSSKYYQIDRVPLIGAGREDGQ